MDYLQTAKIMAFYSCFNRVNYDEVFHETSFIYKITNERIDLYKDFLHNHSNALSVIAAGDQIIEMINGDVFNIDCFDISVFPKFYLMLKLASIEGLTLDEYKKFYLDDNNIFDRTCNDLYYDKIRSNLEKVYRDFWDNLFLLAQWPVIYKSRLFSDALCLERIDDNMISYLKEDIYNSLKEKIKRINLTFKEGNILNIYKDYKNHDLVYLSNILDYVNEEQYFKMIKELGITNDNILSYIVNYNRYIKSHNNMDEFDIHKISYYDTYDSALMIYKKKK